MEKRKEQCKSELSKREAGEEGFRECILPKCFNKILYVRIKKEKLKRVNFKKMI